jgi:argininosuccinate synthase
MSKRVVVACFGDTESAALIHQLAQGADVIAVALDFGGAVSLTAMRETALAAGATRCHAFDVREEFAREALLPALKSRTFANPEAAFATLATAFAARKLEDLARLESATVVEPVTVTVAARPLPAARDPLQLLIGFHDGIPVSINGVEMTLTELMESIETITGQPALQVLDREMSRSREQQFA